jgi:hypothetical protein
MGPTTPPPVPRGPPRRYYFHSFISQQLFHTVLGNLNQDYSVKEGMDSSRSCSPFWIELRTSSYGHALIRGAKEGFGWGQERHRSAWDHKNQRVCSAQDRPAACLTLSAGTYDRPLIPQGCVPKASYILEGPGPFFQADEDVRAFCTQPKEEV